MWQASASTWYIEKWFWNDYGNLNRNSPWWGLEAGLLILHYSNVHGPPIDTVCFFPPVLEHLFNCVFSLLLTLKFVIFYHFKISLNFQWVLHSHVHLCLQPLCNYFCFLLCVSAIVYTQIGKSISLLSLYHIHSSIKINVFSNVNIAYFPKLWRRCSNTNNL